MSTASINAAFAGPAQRFLITGGSGFIGRLLCRALLAQGHAVMLLVRNPHKLAKLFGTQPALQFVTSLTQLDAATSFDAVINLSGERILGPRWTTARKQILLDSRVGVTQALGHWIARAQLKPRLMLSASAIGYYGVQSPDDHSQLNEQSTPQSIFVSTLCQEWERAAQHACADQVPLAILRFGVVFGHSGALPTMLLPIRLGLGGRIGSGKQAISWIHIDDLLAVIAWLLFHADASARCGVYNLTSPAITTQHEFAKTAGRLLHRPTFLPLPAAAVDLLFGEQGTLLVDGQRVYPQRLEQSGYRFRFAELEPALRDLLR